MSEDGARCLNVYCIDILQYCIELIRMYLNDKCFNLKVIYEDFPHYNILLLTTCMRTNSVKISFKSQPLPLMP